VSNRFMRRIRKRDGAMLAQNAIDSNRRRSATKTGRDALATRHLSPINRTRPRRSARCEPGDRRPI